LTLEELSSKDDHVIIGPFLFPYIATALALTLRRLCYRLSLKQWESAVIAGALRPSLTRVEEEVGGRKGVSISCNLHQ
jgi:hypothetical protein